ncbi:BamA/TamA family outer membrane protein [Bdellovibrio sp. HCB288]|uniref:BamA/TamA family outer membrane protein n=1 Tax=Bdellovibrio sp. HCB288 TaxID=3394355 RepID=UPI0039B50349
MKVIVALLLLTFFSTAQAQSIFIDPQDGFLDGSEWLLKHRGFLPVPIIITEPAVGYGFGVALVFMKETEDSRASTTQKFIAPTVYGVLGAATENGTQLGGGFFMHNWDHDHWRYLGTAMAASINLDFYGNSGFQSQRQFDLGYNLKGWLTFHDLRRRLEDSNVFLGIRYIYSDLNVKFENMPPPLANLDPEQENRNGGASVLISYDSRNNTLSPDNGFLAEYRYNVYSENLGGDLDYHTQDLDLQGYFRFNPQWGLATRWLNNWIDDDGPFYAKPFINLRGIPKMRYQGDVATSLEGEARYSPHPRWQILGFGGVGKAGDEFNDLSSAETATSYGLGFRYLIARLLGFQMGLDVARGPEDTVFYIQAGGPWNF